MESIPNSLIFKKSGIRMASDFSTSTLQTRNNGEIPSESWKVKRGMISILEFIFSQTIKCEDIIENHLTQDLKNVASSEHLLKKLLKDVLHQDKGASQERGSPESSKERI